MQLREMIRKFIAVTIAGLAIAGLTVSCSEDAVVIPADLIEYGDGPFVFYEKLSDYGFFEGELKDLDPVDVVFPFELSTPLFSDYTIKDRFIWLPGGTSIEYRSGGIVDFPPGTVLIKNFSSLDESDDVLRLETRLLLLDPYNGEWRVMVYLWNEDRTDADMHFEGEEIAIRVRNSMGALIETMYHVPNTNECKRCHSNGGEVTPIGPRIRSLNHIPEGTAINQLDQWASEGRLTGLPSTGVPVLPDWADESTFSLDERARAYLDINCAHCHRVGGDAYSSALFLDYDQADSSHLGIYKTPLAAGPGTGGLTYDIVPGDPDASIVHYRMNSNTPGVAMPELARSVVHEEGVALIRAWIESL